MNTLKLFNAVIEKPSNEDIFISEEGYIIEPGALWAKDKIVDFYNQQKLSGEELNKTFHKSWQIIKADDRFYTVVEQIKHYLSTYGSGFQDEVYIPGEYLDIPDVKLTYKVIKALSKEDMAERGLNVLRSGIALQEKTIDALINVISLDCGYQFTGDEGIRNKEAVIKIADVYGILPKDTMEFFRYIVYRATDSTLLIKNRTTFELIKNSSYNPGVQFQNHGLEKLAAIFNRFKPLFLAFRTKCPSVINKISSLSKKGYHRPLVQNPLNLITSQLLTENDEHWLENATPYALFKALALCQTRLQGQTAFVYRIRNGKSFITEGKEADQAIVQLNELTIVEHLKKRFNFEGRKVYIPSNIKYALPTSEKMFVGNVPTGTRISGEKLAVGIYWENDWGANDLDLSSINIGGKVGWNSTYNQGSGSLMYSGDITNAPNGATEYLHANKGLSDPTLVMNNVYSGNPDCEYKIVVGQGAKVTESYMQNPNEIEFETKCRSVQKQTILGLFLPEKDGQSFIILNFGAGDAHVSGYSQYTTIAIKALYEQWHNPATFNSLLESLGVEMVNDADEADYDFSIDTLDKDSFTKFFKE